MNLKLGGSAAALALLCWSAPAAFGAGANPAISSAGEISEQKISRALAHFSVGITTKIEVQASLGSPWRTVQYNDMDTLEDEIWEYRARNAQGSYRLHIEFDHRDIVRVIVKIPDKAPGAGGTSRDGCTGLKKCATCGTSRSPKSHLSGLKKI